MYSKYKDEVDSELKKVPIYEKLNNPNYANDAFDKVKARHLEDIINERIEKAVEERLKGNSASVKKPSFTETSSAPNPSKGEKKTVRITPKQDEDDRKYCERNSINLEYYRKVKYSL